MNKNNRTKRQHFIPCMLLVNHSFKCDKAYKSYLYIKDNKTSTSVSIKDLCVSENLYEFDDKTSINYIENILCEYEKKISDSIKKVINKEVLSIKDINNLKYLVTLQILRMPGSIKFTKDLYKDRAIPYSSDYFDRFIRTVLFDTSDDINKDNSLNIIFFNKFW